jgi:hypothetical protein
MDEGYVQEHISIGGIVAPVGGASPLVHGQPAPTKAAHDYLSASHSSSPISKPRLFTDHRDGIVAERTLGELFAQADAISNSRP